MRIRIRIIMGLAITVFFSVATVCFGASEKELLRKIDAIKNDPVKLLGRRTECRYVQSADARKERFHQTGLRRHPGQRKMVMGRINRG
ncbi:MAG: hypothetical protein DRP97_00800 [Candidatus Latescibacterota bacterium]|nr:MAG: hypothetical protein DRP97_00800 [Candidatus Latescibacterota bacterium]